MIEKHTSDRNLCLGYLSAKVTAVLPSVVFGGILDDQAQRLACVKELIFWPSF